MKVLYILSLLLVLPATAMGAGSDTAARKVLREINRAYMNLDKVKCRVVMSSFASAKDRAPKASMAFEVTSGPGFTHTLSEDLEVLRHDGYEVVVDHRMKYIFLEKKGSPAFAFSEFVNLDTILNSATYARVSEKDGLGTCEIGLEGDEFDKVEIRYEVATKHLRSVRFHMTQQDIGGKVYRPLMEISFSHTPAPSLKPADYTRGRYVELQDGIYRPRPRYAGYEVIPGPSVKTKK